MDSHAAVGFLQHVPTVQILIAGLMIGQFLARTRVVIPTFNAERHFVELSRGLALQGIEPRQVLVIDSSSSDRTVPLFRNFGAEVCVIPQSEFNHGGTRAKAANIASEAEFLIYLTQDAVPAHPEAFKNLLAVFVNEEVGMAYGRQLPRPTARAIERHARLFNYPPKGREVRSLGDRERFRVRTIFCSDSFAAYRHRALLEVGGFPLDALFAEDQIVAGRMLLNGGKLAYVSDACVTHSHDYTIRQEFKRYFDVGVFHSRNSWLLQEFGKAEGEGLRFVLSELSYLWKHEPWSIFAIGPRTLVKYLGYRLGRLESHWSNESKARMSMAPHYWKKST